VNKRWFPPLFAFALLLAFFEAGASLGWINPALIPAPHAVLQALINERDAFQTAFVQTALATVAGFALAAAGGFALALLFSRFAGVRRAVLPFAIFFQTVPIIAIAPLMVIYFGFGWQTVMAASAVVSIFPVLANTLLGLESTDPGFVELMRVYGATPGQILWKVRLPAAYAPVYAGLKVAAGLSVIGSVAGEFVAGGGLGALIDSARTQQRIDIVFAALFLLSLLGLALIGMLQLLNRIINAYRPYGLFLKDE
jgi:NitT/TauT family transport system permease protein